MARLKKQNGSQSEVTGRRRAKSLEVSEKGPASAADMVNLMLATINDNLTESITTDQASVTIRASNSVLSWVQLQYKYGRPRPGAPGERDLVLIGSGKAAE